MWACMSISMSDREAQGCWPNRPRLALFCSLKLPATTCISTFHSLRVTMSLQTTLLEGKRLREEMPQGFSWSVWWEQLQREGSSARSSQGTTLPGLCYQHHQQLVGPGPGLEPVS